MGFRVFIPARHASTRLPGKPLLPLAGRPLIRHVWERARASGAASVVIATDDERIASVARDFGAEVCMTSAQHRSGTERLAQACVLLGVAAEEIIVNLQGDEPEMPPALLRQVAELLECSTWAEMATLAVPIDDAHDLADPNVVKVVRDSSGRALYFSRAPIPWHRTAFAAGVPPSGALPASVFRRHVGLYAYRAAFLTRFAAWPEAPLESIEALEQLRALHHGAGIAIADALEDPGIGVDTPADLLRAERRCSATRDGA